MVGLLRTKERKPDGNTKLSDIITFEQRFFGPFAELGLDSAGMFGQSTDPSSTESYSAYQPNTGFVPAFTPALVPNFASAPSYGAGTFSPAQNQPGAFYQPFPQMQPPMVLPPGAQYSMGQYNQGPAYMVPQYQQPAPPVPQFQAPFSVSFFLQHGTVLQSTVLDSCVLLDVEIQRLVSFPK